MKLNGLSLEAQRVGVIHNLVVTVLQALQYGPFLA